MERILRPNEFEIEFNYVNCPTVKGAVYVGCSVCKKVWLARTPVDRLEIEKRHRKEHFGNV